MHVTDHDGDSLGVNGAEIGVLEQTDQVSLSGFLEGQHSLRLESHVWSDAASDVLDDSLERKLSDQEISLKLNWRLRSFGSV